MSMGKKENSASDRNGSCNGSVDVFRAFKNGSMSRRTPNPEVVIRTSALE